MMRNKLCLAVLAVGLISISVSARPGLAVPAVFFDRDDPTTFMTSFPNSQAKFNQFTAALGSFGVDNIDTAVGPNPILVFGGTGITATTQGVLAQSAPGFQIGSQALLELDAVGAAQVHTLFTFNQYITAFGAYVIQGGDGTNNNPTTFRLRDTATNASVDVPVQVGPGWGADNAFFLGVIDSVPFNEVSIIESTDFSDGILYDNIVAGNIPEPGSLALLMLGGACALWPRARFSSPG
jgi:PEP-CTERM motif